MKTEVYFKHRNQPENVVLHKSGLKYDDLEIMYSTNRFSYDFFADNCYIYTVSKCNYNNIKEATELFKRRIENKIKEIGVSEYEFINDFLIKQYNK